MLALRGAIISTALIALAATAQAGAWTQKEGEALLISTVDYSTATRGFDDGASLQGQDRFKKAELRSYLEYGLTDWATLVAQPEFRWKHIGDGLGEEVIGLGRADVGMRVRLKQSDPWIYSIQTSIRAPGAWDTIAPANGGDTEWEVDARILSGRGFSAFDRHGFIDLQAGYRHRFEDPADELHLDLTAGLNLTDNLLGVAQVFGSHSIGTPRGNFESSASLRLALSGVYKLNETWSVQAGLSQTAAGRNALFQSGAFVALWRKF